MSVPENDPGILAESSFNFLVGAVIGIPVVGFGLIIALMAIMKNGMDFHEDMIFVVVFMTFLLLLVAETGLIVLMFNRTKGRKPTSPKSVTPVSTGEVKRINETEMNRLNAPTFDGIPSVTEHTTRTLDGVHRKTDRS